MEIIENIKGQRTHEIRIFELKTQQSKSFSIKSKDSLQKLFIKIQKALNKGE